MLTCLHNIFHRLTGRSSHDERSESFTVPVCHDHFIKENVWREGRGFDMSVLFLGRGVRIISGGSGRIVLSKPTMIISVLSRT